ncbi:AAL134Wp [Eremothecium gossypii ATCC 10895]|uniref:AAL134Wp n=1 Tax=Eremothecium gossypii (strain ATCC 10895 / CBS 109.51 / FGSC 9923 / NRRL Y-1056) TaxID=284811 RepID=Q75F62_EREGS|nr:AAL134Wp [Eremothecium gossypii ATCC 10895]AAS50232.1 AAL134Wp [Eremothecium gossypii ATCC 10895]AEY94517.1 FAAL134Wp [Eremothecium gossypii FDAG1]AGO09856.1 AaceriAAL134Wp [[Ashbya] aceris (nom. inval.)]
MGVIEKIKAIEEEMARTQKNKATEHHLGLLKGKLARYRQQLLEESTASSGGGGTGFEVAKSGDARVVLIGYPSVGKSSLLGKVTTTKSEVAHYAFTTLTSVPGVLKYQGAEIQMVDLPGIIHGASKGKGRGRQVIATARTADLIVMVLDATKSNHQRESLERELETMGIRLNKEKPNIYFKKKETGGLKITFTSPDRSNLTEEAIKLILRDYRIHNADILVRDSSCTIDDFIDVLNEQHRNYIKCLYVYNKIDAVSLEEVDRLAREPNTVVMSCEMDLGLEDVVDEIWYQLHLNRVFTKKRGVRPDFSDPLVVRNGSTVGDLCHQIHRDFKDKFKYALVWGSSAKHSPQKCGLNHKIHDEDVISLFTK